MASSKIFKLKKQARKPGLKELPWAAVPFLISRLF
jgi:hypothetical protein